MHTQLDESLTGFGEALNEDLGSRPMNAVEDVATQPIDISSLILEQNEMS